MVARQRNDDRGAQLDAGKRKDLALDLQRELERDFMLDQLQELSTDFADNPEQIGLYLADLEVAGLLTQADKGMVFRRLWETMGPAFADRAFGMTERALIDGDVLAAEIASDAFVDISGGRATFDDPAEFARVREASSALSALASALGLKIDVPTPELKRRPDHIHDIDPERAHKTAEVLGSLGSQLGLDANRMDVRVDDEARAKTAGQGIWGLMTDGTVFLDPELYDPETTAGRHLLAHEVVHVAQLENRLRGANDAPDLYQAEAEADTLSTMFAETGNVGAAPLASLARYDQAACGPREMATPPGTETEPRGPTTEVVREPPLYDIVQDCFDVPPIQFQVDKFEIAQLMEGMLEVLQKVATSIKTYPQITGMHIEGHTSTTATAAHNLELSKNRATKVTDWLQSVGKVAGITFTHEGYGETLAREEEGITDDKTSREVTAQRKVVFRITHVEGKPVPKDWKPTRKVISVPGKTITRTYDPDGNLVSEEVVLDTPGGPEAQTTAPTAPVNAVNPNQSAPAGQGTTSTGQAEPSVAPNSPAAQQQPSASQETPVKPKMKPLKPGAKPRARRNPAWVTSAVTSQVLQAKAGSGGLSAGGIDSTTRASGAGEALSSGVRTRFESAFGADFSDVRVHRGSSQATGIGAAAFARGTDIHFAPGRFDTESSSGLAILGHELTHIVQQRAGRVAVSQGKGTHINVERTLEAEADLLGSRAARGESVHVQGSSAGLYARAARGDADTIQYKDEGGAAAEGGTRPEHAEIRLGGQRIRARMPAGGTSPGRLTVDFSSAVSVPGLSLSQASLVFNDQWEITEGHISAALAIGSYVNCQDLRLVVRQREDATGKYAELAAEVNDADFKIEGLLDSKINLRLSTSGISGTAHVAFADLRLGEHVTLSGGTLDFSLTEAGEATVSGSVNGTVAVGDVTANLELRGEAMSNGSLSAAAKISIASPVPVPGVEGVTIKSGEINGSYKHNEEWTLNGNLLVNVRDWVEGEITTTYKQPAAGASEWELNGTLRQLQPYSIGTPEEQVTLENGELDLHFLNGDFISVAARTDWSTTNFRGRLTGDYKVQEQLLNAQGTVSLAVPELPVGTDGIKFTRIEAVVMLEDNVLKTFTGAATVIFPYDHQDTFKLEGNDIIFNVPDEKVTGTATVTTLRDLDFGDTAGYNAKIGVGAVGTLSVADNNLLGVSGGLAFNINHAAENIGEGTVDINFDGPTQQLGATANFTLTNEAGFGVPDRLTGPVMLKPGGQFRLTIVNSALGAATVTGVGFEVKQEGEGATGKIEGQIDGNYNFETSKLTALGTAHLSGDWPLSPVDGVTICFKEGGQLDVAVVDNALTSVNGNFPYEATIAAQGRVPEIQLTGNLNGNYSGESKKFGGALEGQLVNEVVIPVGADTITVKPGATLIAAITDNVPAEFSATFDVDYTRAGTLFCSGHVETATYDFRTGNFGFEANLTLKTKIEKQTEDGKWKFVVNEESTVGVKVEESELRLITGSIPFEVHDDQGALLNGNLTEAELNVQDLKFTGTLDVALARDIAYPRGSDGAEAAPEGSPPVQAIAKKDVSHITGQITNNVLTTVSAALHFGVNLGGEEYGAGELTGEINMPTFQFAGTGKITLVKDLILGEETESSEDPIAGWQLVFPMGQGLDVAITNNQLDEANLNLNAKLLRSGEECAVGTVTGRYKLGDPAGYCGSIDAHVTKRITLRQGQGRFDYHLEPETGFQAEMVDSSLQSATVTAKIAASEGATDKVLIDVGGTYTKGVGITGGGSIEVVDAVLLKDGEWKLFLDAGSGGHATVTQSKLEEIGGTIKLRIDKGEESFAAGDFEANYRVTEDGGSQITGQGRVTIPTRIDITPPGMGDFTVFLCGGSNIGAAVRDSELDYVDGAIQAELEHGGALFARADLQAKYQRLGTPDFTGSGTLETVAPYDVTTFAGYELKLGVGASISGKITAFELDELTANIPLELHKDSTKVVEASLSGNYKHADKTFSGEGSAKVVNRITIAEGVGSQGYSFYLEPATGVSATVSENALTQVTGSLVVNIADAPSPDQAFLKASGTATYNGGDAPTVTANGALEVIRDKEMLTSTSGYVVWLKVGSGATVDVAANELNSIGGTVKIETHKDGAPFARVELGGTYTPSGGFDGNGEAELLVDYQVVDGITMGDESYSVWVLKGTGADIQITASDIAHVGGTVHAMIRDSAGDFIQIDAEADYDFPGENLSGSGSITVLKPKQLAEFDGNTLWLAQGSGISGSMSNNNLQRVDGTLNLQLKDETGHWLTVEFNGGYDAEGGTGFTGTGAVTVLQDKKLAEVGEYSFWLAEGGGASAKIEQNKLTEVHGAIPFKVFDAEPLPLIRGQAEAHYYTSSGLFSGTGEVYLARDVEYPLGEGMLVFKEGSGGGGTVTDNELERLTGVLKVDIHDGDGPMVGCEADGVYNAVTNTIERLHGTATLLRPISVGGEGDNAMIRIEELSGSALVENNELKELSGSLTICMPRFNNATGHFEGGWQKGAAGDIFWGSGWIEVTLFDDPGKGRKASGRVEGTYNKDGTFQVSGEIDYKLNQMIGGSVGMTVDQELDPILEGTLEITEVPLVPGRDLFKWGKEFNLFQVTAWAGPVPIDISGGVNVGIGLSMLPLTFSATIGVTNFRPLSQDVQVPDFTAHAELNTGLRMAAKLQPWAQLGVGIAGVASAGIALQGEAGVNVDVNVSPFADLKGEGGVYSGKLGVGLEIAGSGSLALMPQVYAQLLGKRFPYNLTEIRHDLGELFSYNYDFAFPFGDQPSAPTAGSGAAPSTTTAAASTTSVSHETKPAADPATSGAANRPGAIPGGPDMNAADNDAEQEGEKEGPMAEMMAKIDSIQAWGEKIGTVAKVGGELVSMLMFMVTIPFPFGVAIAGGYLAYKLLTGALTIDEIVDAATIVWDLIQSIDMSMITGLLPEWLVNLWNQIKGKSWDELLTGMIDTMSEWLSNEFPSAAPVIRALSGVAKTVIQTIARIITAIMSGNFGLDTFLDICRTVGGAVLSAVLEMVGDAVVGAVSDAAGAVVDFVASLW